MSERRFVIKEVTNSMLSYEDSLQQVTESELKRRILDILVSIHTTDETDPGWNWRINHLLHGEGKEEPDPWEAWIQEMPSFRIQEMENDQSIWEYKLKQWFRKMPRRGRKEEPIPRPDEWPHVPLPKKPQPDPWEAFENELRRRYELCPGNAPAGSILLAVLNAVAKVRRMPPRGK